MTRNPPPWPNGARCAVAFSFDLDADSVVHATHREAALDMPNAIAHMRYDPLVAVPRLVELFASQAVPLTCFVPSWVIETYPEAIALVAEHGFEIAHHGEFHERPSSQTEAGERRTLEAGIRAIERLTGSPPAGYRAPYYALSSRTLDLLTEYGFLYDSSLFADDVPIILRGDRGDIIELPVPSSVDDYNQYVSSRAFDYLMKVSAPRQAMEVYRAEFDAMRELGGLWVSVWHPAVSGRPAQAVAVRDLLGYMQDKGDVWFATLEQVATWTRSLIETGRWEPRVDTIPFYRTPVVTTPA